MCIVCWLVPEHILVLQVEKKSYNSCWLINFPIISFKYNLHSDLGRVVQAIIREFERFPPNLINSNVNSPINITSPHGNMQQQPVLTAAKSLDSAAGNEHHDNSAKNPNKLADSLPNLSALSLEELKQLDTDPEFFDDFIEEMSVVQHLNEELDSMISQVEIISSKCKLFAIKSRF